MLLHVISSLVLTEDDASYPPGFTEETITDTDRHRHQQVWQRPDVHQVWQHHHSSLHSAVVRSTHCWSLHVSPTTFTAHCTSQLHCTDHMHSCKPGMGIIIKAEEDWRGVGRLPRFLVVY